MTDIPPSDPESNPSSNTPTEQSPDQLEESARQESVLTDVKLAESSEDPPHCDESSSLGSDIESPPSFPSPPPKPASRPKVEALTPGTTIDDFEIVDELGRGAFAVVYLARQISLDRLVALKITADIGSEGRTMARLEHQHIVQVYFETVDPPSSKRLLCMQLVPGTSLRAVIIKLHRSTNNRPTALSAPKTRSSQGTRWNGKDLLAILHDTTNLPEVLDPSALHDREALAKMDDVEATAWIGARLGEALDFAHRQGVLHRDIKPANILVNQYGRPMLADFNISQVGQGGPVGGTLPYMAPEHLDAFNTEVEVTSKEVDERSDIYSLGIVLKELLHGRQPLSPKKLPSDMAAKLKQISELRRNTKPTCGIGPPNSRKVLEQTIGQCLEPDPTDRFTSGKQLADALDGCRRLRQVERELPESNALIRAATKHPFRWLILLALLPHLVGSVVNFSYNKMQIIDKLTGQQESLFWKLALGYNLLVFPIGLFIFWRAMRPVWSTWQAMETEEPVDESQVEDARRRLIALPAWVAGLAILGWLPGGLLFPAVLDMVYGTGNWTFYASFLVSFTLSALIVIAYSYGGVQYVALRVLYPQMWRDATDFQSRAREELKSMQTRHTVISLLAVSIPLFAAMGFILFDIDVRFRYLAVILIALGLIGNEVARATTRRLTQTLVALTGKE